jgi:hypothetical protein
MTHLALGVFCVGIWIVFRLLWAFAGLFADKPRSERRSRPPPQSHDDEIWDEVWNEVRQRPSEFF